MGKTPQPLTIIVSQPWVTRPEIEALREKGHTIVAMDSTADLILHPNAHRWEEAYWKMLPQALTQARRVRKEAKKK